MAMIKQPNWTNWFTNHPSNDAGNRNLQAFSDVLSSGISTEAKLRDLVDEIDTVILAADANRNVMLFHSPKNFGGTRSRPENKVLCMIGFGARATCVLPALQSAFADVRIVVPSVHDLGGCTSAEDVANLPVPDQNGVVGLEGSAIFIPGPVFRNAIIESVSRNPFDLIPIMYQVARDFDQANNPATTSGLTHADDLCAWLFGVKTGLVPETRYSVNPDDAEVEAFNLQRHSDCITFPINVNGPRAGETLSLEGNSVISQLTNALTIQNEYLEDANVINRRNQILAEERKEKEKDRTKKIHPAILSMLKRAAAVDSHDDESEIAPSCLHFINCDNIGMAQFELTHQFASYRLDDVGFAAGTIQALHVGEFLYADSISPSNFTVFAFFEQAPNSGQQQDYLICHLIQEQGQKKSLEEIKSSLKQTVHVPKDFDGLGSQLVLFATASAIFFGKESICTDRLDQLVLLVGRNKKALRDQIALDEFFPSKFLLAVDRRVQRWLRSCQNATLSRSHVNDNILDFDNLLEQVLNGSFHMVLPPSFKKVDVTPKLDAKTSGNDEKEPKGDPNNSKKKRKSEDGNGNLVRNTAQDEDFVCKAGENWKETYSKQFPHDRPFFDEANKVKMCARWFIKGDCYDNCSRKASHVSKDNLSADKKASFLGFMKKCREEGKKSN
jgi:hypothetical protein